MSCFRSARGSGNPVVTLFIVAVVAAAIYGAFRIYLDNKYTKMVDEVVNQAALFANVTYRDVSVEMNGEVVITDLSIRAHALPEEIFTVDKITFVTPGIQYIMTSGNKLQRGEMPDKVGVRIKGIHMSLFSELLDKWGDAVKVMNREINRYVTPVCNGVAYFGPAHYKELGYEELVIDVYFGYEFKNNKFYITADFGAQDMGSWAVVMTIGGISGPNVRSVMMAQAPEFSRIEISYYDDSYTSRVLDYCARASAMSRENYIEAELTQTDKYYDVILGVIPGAQIKKAFRTYLKEPNEIRLSMNPAPNFNPQTIYAYNPVDLPSLLNMSLLVNNQPVALDIKITDKKYLTFDDIFAGKAGTGTGASARKRKRAYEAPKAAYQSVSIAELGTHVGKRARIQTSEGNTRKGWIKSVSDHEVILERYVMGGEVENIVKVSSISSAEVLLMNKPEVEASQ